MPASINVLICDDQATIRQLMRLLLGTLDDVGAIAEAADAEGAWERMAQGGIDLVLLDLELPGRDGFALLERLMREAPAPVLMISGSARPVPELEARARALGAIGFLRKPDGVTTTHEALLGQLAERIAALAAAQRQPAARPATADRAGAGQGPLIVIGASTGGVVAVTEVLRRVPQGLAPILVTQHMLPGYADGFAARLALATSHPARVACGGEPLTRDSVLIAPSDKHLAVRRRGPNLYAELDESGKVAGHRPSCDRLFQSAARAAGADVIGVILTGMGRDGAEGLLSLRRAGARTLAQDAASCVVFGMPKAALELGGAERQVPLGRIGAEIVSLIENWPDKRAGAARLETLS